MPPKKRVELPDHVRTAVLQDVALDYLASLEADEKAKIRIYLALEQGVTTREIEDKLQVPQQTVSRWGRQGKEALERREREARGREPGGHSADEDPVRSGELEPLG